MSCSISVLSDNLAGASCGAEHGFSLLIEADKTILFDAGASDLFLKNAGILKKDISKVEMAVLSHGHWDHGNGLLHLPYVPLYCHSGVFMKRYRKNNDVHIGLKFGIDKAQERFDLHLTDKVLQLSEQVFYLGQIPRVVSFESDATKYMDENGNPDFVPDETALAIKTEKGLVVVSGCAHAGICNITRYACEVTGVKEVEAVIGGFHLKADNEVARQTASWLKEMKVKKVYPMHCTSFPASYSLYSVFRCSRPHTGANLVF